MMLDPYFPVLLIRLVMSLYDTPVSAHSYFLAESLPDLSMIYGPILGLFVCRTGRLIGSLIQFAVDHQQHRSRLTASMCSLSGAFTFRDEMLRPVFFSCSKNRSFVDIERNGTIECQLDVLSSSSHYAGGHSLGRYRQEDGKAVAI